MRLTGFARVRAGSAPAREPSPARAAGQWRGAKQATVPAVDGLVRLWIVSGAQASADAGAPALAGLARLFAARRPAALYAAHSHAAHADVRGLAAALQLEVREIAHGDTRAALSEALTGIAREHDGVEVLCWLPAELAQAAVALVFARSGDPSPPPLLPRPLQLSGVDWPSGRDPRAVPGLCGYDLDWLPPWRPGPASRFPGGPGVAASGRS